MASSLRATLEMKGGESLSSGGKGPWPAGPRTTLAHEGAAGAMQKWDSVLYQWQCTFLMVTE